MAGGGTAENMEKFVAKYKLIELKKVEGVADALDYEINENRKSTVLHIAIGLQWHQLVKFLVDRNCDPNFKDAEAKDADPNERTATALHICAALPEKVRQEAIDKLETLLQGKVEAELQTLPETTRQEAMDKLQTLLQDKVEVVLKLLPEAPRQEAKEKPHTFLQGKVLSEAVLKIHKLKEGDVERYQKNITKAMLRMLQEAGGRLHERDTDGYSVLHRLIQNYRDKALDYIEALHTAYIVTTEELRSKTAPNDEDSKTPEITLFQKCTTQESGTLLHQALAVGANQTAAYLIEQGENITTKYKDCSAVQMGYFEQKDADFLKIIHDACYKTSRTDWKKELERLLKQTIDNRDTETAKIILDLLLNYGDMKLWKFLEQAVTQGVPELTDLLLGYTIKEIRGKEAEFKELFFTALREDHFPLLREELFKFTKSNSYRLFGRHPVRWLTDLITLKCLAGRSLLHCAAIYGNGDVVTHLLDQLEHDDVEGGVNVLTAGQSCEMAKRHCKDKHLCEGLTALFIACWHGKADVIRCLIWRGATLDGCKPAVTSVLSHGEYESFLVSDQTNGGDAEHINCMDVAILCNNEDSVNAIISSCKDYTKLECLHKGTLTIKRLIYEMPDQAKLMFTKFIHPFSKPAHSNGNAHKNKPRGDTIANGSYQNVDTIELVAATISTNNEPEDKSTSKHVFELDLLLDHTTNNRSQTNSNDKDPPTNNKSQTNSNDKDSGRTARSLWGRIKDNYRRNKLSKILTAHPLELMTDFEHCNELLDHPLTLALVRKQFQSAAWMFFIFLLVYSVFLGTFSTFFLFVAPKPENSGNCSSRTEAPERPVNWVVMQYIIVVCVALLVFYEIFWIVFDFWEYILENVLSNCLHWLVFITCTLVTFVNHMPGCQGLKASDTTLACVAFFAAWINYILILRKLPWTGKYVTMMLHVWISILKLSVILLVNIFIFASLFHVLLGQQVAGYRYFPAYMVKHLVMLLGEINYDDIFHGDEEITHKLLTYIFFVLLVLFGCIGVMNLFVGMAVSDVKSLVKTSKYIVLGLQIDMELRMQKLKGPPGLGTTYTYEITDKTRLSGNKLANFLHSWNRLFWSDLSHDNILEQYYKIRRGEQQD